LRRFGFGHVTVLMLEALRPVMDRTEPVALRPN
jgi:hypothetical protein